MKKVGIVGGMGPESTVDYYQTIISKFQTKIESKEDRLLIVYLNINSCNIHVSKQF